MNTSCNVFVGLLGLLGPFGPPGVGPFVPPGLGLPGPLGCKGPFGLNLDLIGSFLLLGSGLNLDLIWIRCNELVQQGHKTAMMFIDDWNEPAKSVLKEKIFTKMD